jgi:tripartite-type tricarboxylate transporter receptor subunit TctC
MGDETMIKRRDLLAASTLLAMPALGQGAWPNRPVRVIVGFPPGGSLDVMTRLACEVMTQRLGQSFVVETRSGASGNIGAEALARAAPDGYTIGTVSMHNVVINPMLFTRLPFDPAQDFQWISAMWDLPNVAVVPAQHVPARNLAEFLTWARARPQGISYGSSGVGTTIHLSGAYLLNRGGIQGTHVAFRGAAQTIPAMLSGDLQLAVDNLASYTPVIAEGRIRALAVTMPERWPTLPEVPTMAEAGLDNFNVSPWHLWAAPAGTSRAVGGPLRSKALAGRAGDSAVIAKVALGRRPPLDCEAERGAH